ncbi:hypothetical protein AAW14_01350 [Streptomyces hygroscopicus]|nr:hypothetical protein [Streptomyces hygroscopicus]
MDVARPDVHHKLVGGACPGRLDHGLDVVDTDHCSRRRDRSGQDPETGARSTAGVEHGLPRGGGGRREDQKDPHDTAGRAAQAVRAWGPLVITTLRALWDLPASGNGDGPAH